MSELKVVGKVVNVLPATGGTAQGSGKAWSKQIFVIQTDDQYNNLYAFEIFNNKIPVPVLNSKAEVNFNVDTREYQGKYYTNLSAWAINAPQVHGNAIPPTQPYAQPQAPTGQPQQAPQGGVVKDDFLPF